jgi:hypothetical protein
MVPDTFSGSLLAGLVFHYVRLGLHVVEAVLVEMILYALEWHDCRTAGSVTKALAPDGPAIGCNTTLVEPSQTLVEGFRRSRKKR